VLNLNGPVIPAPLSHEQPVNGFPKRQLTAFLVAIPVLVGIFVLAGSATADPTVSSKRADAQRAWEQINQMDQQIEAVGNKWQGAQYHLSQTKNKLNATKISLNLARKSLDTAHHALAKRLISVYMEQGDASDSTVAILFQATSIQDMIDRVNAAQRISDHDSRVVKQVKVLRDKTASDAAALEKLQARQQSYANQISSQLSALRAKQVEREAYYKSVKREIASLQAEAQRQAELAAARARQTVNSYSSAAVPTGPSPNYTAPPASSIGQAVVNAAMSRLNAPYVWGAAGPTTFDCSGLVVWSFEQAGRPGMPHYTYSLMAGGSPVALSDLQPGDLVFFYGGSHVGIYIGGGQFVHAPHTGTVVQVASLGSYSSVTAARRY
jgi:cell wall-associated NlpC family hydrolase